MSFFVVTNAAYGGKYCEDGTFDDGMGNVKPKYRKTGTSLYMYYVETNWRINDVGSLGELGSNVYAFASGGNTPPTGMNWTDNNTGNDLIVADDFYSTSTTPTSNNTYVYYGNTYNGKPLYYLGGLELKYETSAGMNWVIENPDPDPDNPIRLYQSDSSASTPPLTGWFIVNGSSPPPTLVGPTCGETATTTTTTTTTSAPGGSTTTTTTTTTAPTTKSIQITSTNYNGQTAQVTFYSVAAPTTPVNLGPHTLPYSRSGDDVYGSYELNFTAYNKVCVVALSGPTTTTTTTTTATPTVGLFTFSNAGDSVYNGCYAYAGYQHNGKPVYVNTIRSNVLISWNTESNAWYADKSGAVGGFYDYLGFGSFASPADGVLGWISPSTTIDPAPTHTMGCGVVTTTTVAPAGSVQAYFVTTNATYGGKYCEDGTYNGKPKYRKIGTSFYMYYVETNWRINDIGNLGNSGSNVYGLTIGANTPPTGLNWVDMDRSEEFVVSNSFYSTSATATIFNTYISFGTYNGKPEYDKGGIKIRYEPSILSWVIDDLSQNPDDPTRLYQNSSTANTPPLTGWIVVNSSSPAPTLTGPNC